MSSKFDIIDFINSSAIANHCRRIGHGFSTLDMAYLIWASEKHSVEESVTSGANPSADKTAGQARFSPALPLDENQRDLLLALLRGESVRERITAQHGMPEIVADELNEALFDEIGDSVVECDGDELLLVEEYREDILELLGGG